MLYTKYHELGGGGRPFRSFQGKNKPCGREKQNKTVGQKTRPEKTIAQVAAGRLFLLPIFLFFLLDPSHVHTGKTPSHQRRLTTSSTLFGPPHHENPRILSDV